NPLLDSHDNSTSSDDESFSDEDVLKENFKIYSNPLSDEEIISTKIDPHHFNAESDLIESLLNRDTLIISSSKIDSLLEEFSGELAHTDLIPPGINEANFDPEEDICLVEKLLYDNSSLSDPVNTSYNTYDARICNKKLVRKMVVKREKEERKMRELREKIFINNEKRYFSK
ncbi:hypothetical protein Tco_0628303, partial [Tanacetum coccineum]